MSEINKNCRFTFLSMNEVHCLLVLYIWKSLKNTGPDVVGGKSGTLTFRFKMMRDFSNSAFKTGIKNE